MDEDTLAGDIETAMPRDWLTPDLRMIVAEWLAEMIRTEPWNITERVKPDGKD